MTTNMQQFGYNKHIAYIQNTFITYTCELLSIPKLENKKKIYTVVRCCKMDC